MLAIICLCQSAALAQNQWKNIYSEHAWAERDRWQRPEELIRLLGVRQGDVVADMGCHEGYMTFKLARAVGASGIVYAVDLQQARLEKVRKRARAEGLKNIRIVQGAADNPKLPRDSVDRVILLDTYHEIDAHQEILQHVRTSLKKGGRLLICEPIADERRDLSRDEQTRKHELALSHAVGDLRKAGFSIVFEQDNFIDRTKEKGDRMWVIVAQKM